MKKEKKTAGALKAQKKATVTKPKAKKAAPGSGHSGVKKQYLKGSPFCRVTFRLPAEVNADIVCLAGEFNNWDAASTPLKKLKNGDFTVSLTLETGREYQFRYLVNNCEWHNDWCADKYIANEFGQDNSVVIV